MQYIRLAIPTSERSHLNVAKQHDSPLPGRECASWLVGPGTDLPARLRYSSSIRDAAISQTFQSQRPVVGTQNRDGVPAFAISATWNQRLADEHPVRVPVLRYCQAFLAQGCLTRVGQCETQISCQALLHAALSPCKVMQCGKNAHPLPCCSRAWPYRCFAWSIRFT